MKNRNHKILFITGLFLVALTLILSHYSLLPDFWDGFMIGTGLGLLILSFSGLGKRSYKV